MSLERTRGTATSLNVDRWSLLSAADEVRLAQNIEAGRLASERLESGTSADYQGDAMAIREAQLARDEFVCSNLRLVVKCAQRFRNAPGMDFDDHVHHGAEGLMRAIDNWDWRKGHKFSTYAMWWIRVYITRHHAEGSKLIRTPLHVHVLIEKARTAAERLQARGVFNPTIEDIATESGLSRSDAARARAIPHATLASELIADTDSGGPSAVWDRWADADPVGHPEASAIQRDIYERTVATLTELDDEDALIVAMKFGFVDGIEHSITAIARELGVATPTIRKRLKGAMDRLRWLPQWEDFDQDS